MNCSWKSQEHLSLLLFLILVEVSSESEPYERCFEVSINFWMMLRGQEIIWSSFLGIILPFFLQAVKLTSSRTQLPYEYYSLPFCQPSKITYKAENLGVYLSDSVGGCLQGQKQLQVSLLLSCENLLPLIHCVLAVCKWRCPCVGQRKCLS